MLVNVPPLCKLLCTTFPRAVPDRGEYHASRLFCLDHRISNNLTKRLSQKTARWYLCQPELHETGPKDKFIRQLVASSGNYQVLFFLLTLMCYVTDHPPPQFPPSWRKKIILQTILKQIYNQLNEILLFLNDWRICPVFLVHHIHPCYQKQLLECSSRSHWVGNIRWQIAFFLQRKAS